MICVTLLLHRLILHTCLTSVSLALPGSCYLSSRPSSTCSFSLYSSLCYSLSLCWLLCSVLILKSLLLSPCLHPMFLSFFFLPVLEFSMCSAFVPLGFMVHSGFCFCLTVNLSGSAFCYPPFLFDFTGYAASIATILYTVYGINCPSKKKKKKKL